MVEVTQGMMSFLNTVLCTWTESNVNHQQKPLTELKEGDDSSQFQVCFCENTAKGWKLKGWKLEEVTIKGKIVTLDPVTSTHTLRYYRKIAAHTLYSQIKIHQSVSNLHHPHIYQSINQTINQTNKQTSK